MTKRRLHAKLKSLLPKFEKLQNSMLVMVLTRNLLSENDPARVKIDKSLLRMRNHINSLDAELKKLYSLIGLGE